MTTTAPPFPAAFRYADARDAGPHAKVARAFRRATGRDLWPTNAVAQAFAEGLTRGDPVAERFVAGTYHGELGARRAREMVELAQQVGIDNVPDAPESMRALFEEFERVPDWVDPELIEQGAAVWRRWGYTMGAMANAGTMDTYTEGFLAVPLSLSGGYAGDRALHRYLETTKWWIEVSRPGAILEPGSLARAISLHVRILHVSVRARVAGHEEWDSEKWGLPISQSAMLLTVLAGSVAPGLALYGVGHVTTPSEIRALMHFNRYLGYLLGVRCDEWFPETVLEGAQILFMWDATRSRDSGHLGKELVESFVPSFSRKETQKGWEGLRARYHFWLQSGYAGMFMLPWNRRRFDMPSALPGIAYLLVRSPLILAMELLRMVVPPFDRAWQRSSHERWERWTQWQGGGKRAEYDASKGLRR